LAALEAVDLVVAFTEDTPLERLAPVNVEDLLLPGVRIDYRRLENFVEGKSIIVTGGGGSIGAEICDAS
jgi:FlaA1/EpsC-like NDP-sugar epimerase